MIWEWVSLAAVDWTATGQPLDQVLDKPSDKAFVAMDNCDGNADCCIGKVASIDWKVAVPDDVGIPFDVSALRGLDTAAKCGHN